MFVFPGIVLVTTLSPQCWGSALCTPEAAVSIRYYSGQGIACYRAGNIALFLVLLVNLSFA